MLMIKRYEKLLSFQKNKLSQMVTKNNDNFLLGNDTIGVNNKK